MESEVSAPLSMVARLAAALHSLAAWVQEVGLDGKDFDELIDHLWQWPAVDWKTFNQWYDRRPDLTWVGLGDPIPDELQQRCRERGVPVAECRLIVQSITEIVHGNLFGAVNDRRTLDDLRTFEVIVRKRGLSIPPASLFADSLFSEKHGWGHTMTETEVQAWKRAHA